MELEKPENFKVLNAKVGKPCGGPYLNIEAIICLVSVICITI